MIERYNYEGDPNIGLAATATPEHAIIPPEFRREEFLDSEKTATTFIAGTRLAGLFTEGNANCILLPSNTKENERQKLEEAGVEFHVLDSVETALGNLITANDSGAVISRRLEDHREEIEEAFGVDAKVVDIAGSPNPGVASAANNTGVLIHRAATEEEAEKVKNALGVDNVDIGTVNLGSPFVGSGMIVCGQRILVGEDTSGPEVGRIDRTLVRHE